MLSDVAIGYVCFTIGFIGFCGLAAYVAYLCYLSDCGVEEDSYSKEKSDTYD
jgi:hypothetical protein